MGREDEIRVIAYRIWEEEGCCNGRDAEHWFRAVIIWEEDQKKKAVPAGTSRKPKRAASTGKKSPAG